MSTKPPQIRPTHLNRRALVHIRPSSAEQVRDNTGSVVVQPDRATMLHDWGWAVDMIEIRDEDFGQRGLGTDQQTGFDELILEMQAGVWGIVAVEAISRLTRNANDEALFASVARQHDVLLTIGTTVVDFRDVNSAFIGQIVGLNAARANRWRIDLLRRAKRKRAEAGMAVTAGPRGYVKGRHGRWLKDSDPRVRAPLQLVFDKFQELGSAGAVCRYLNRHEIKLPAPPRGQEDLTWREADRQTVIRILRNPAYAGVYVYGLTEVNRAAPRGPSGRPRRVRCPASDWVWIEGHHEPYVSRDAWDDIQRRLTENRRPQPPPGGEHHTP